MKNTFKSNFLFLAFLSLVFFAASCQNANKEAEHVDDIYGETSQKDEVAYDTNNPETMVHAIAEACGGYDNLKALNDVSYDYHYVHPDGLKDISKECYIFDKEISHAKYSTHEINVTPDLEGEVEQIYDGEKAMVYNNGEALTDPKVVGTGHFLRQANYMWFNMMFKLGDEGTVYKYEGQETIDGKTYDVLNVTYDPAATGKEQNDTFILYIDPENHMVDQFKFSLPAFGVEQPVLLAKLTYTEIDGIHVITNREMFAPNPEGGDMVPMVSQTLTNVKFNNGFTLESLSKNI